MVMRPLWYSSRFALLLLLFSSLVLLLSVVPNIAADRVLRGEEGIGEDDGVLVMVALLVVEDVSVVAIVPFVAAAVVTTVVDSGSSFLAVSTTGTGATG